MGLQRFAPTAAAGVLLLLAGIAGCSDDSPQSSAVDEQPTAADPEPANDANGQSGSAEDGDTTSSDGDQLVDDPTQYETAEDMPDELLQAEMEAFVGEFFAELNEAIRTGKTTEARDMATEECEPCWRPLDSIDETYAEGNRYLGGEFSQDFDVRIVAVEENIVETHVDGSFAERQVVDENGAEMQSHDSYDFIYYFSIHRGKNGSYIITLGENYT